MRVLSCFITLSVNIAPHGKDVGGMDILSNVLRMHMMECPEFSSVEREHEW